MTQTPWRVLGGPLGTHTSARSSGPGAWAQLVVLLAAIPVLAALALRGWCLTQGFEGSDPLWRACYSDLPSALVAIQGGGAPAGPIVAAVVQRVLALPFNGSGLAAQTGYVLAWGLLSLVLVGLIAVAVLAFRARRPDRALLVVLSPVLVTTLLISSDIVGVALAVLGLVAWRRGAAGWAGALLVLATFARGSALILLVVVVVVAWREGWDRSALRRLVLGAGLGAAGVLGLGALFGIAALTDPLRDWWHAGASYGSVWLLPHLVGYPLLPGVVPFVQLLGWLVAIGLVVYLAIRSWRRLGLAELAVVGMAAVLMTGVAVPVQASLWLVPLVALSAIAWRDKLIWAAIEVAYYPMVWLYIGQLEPDTKGLPAPWYALFLILRLLAMGWLIWCAIDARPPAPRRAGPPGRGVSGGTGAVSPGWAEAPRPRTAYPGAG
ncbi:MAG: hypothetical protein Q4G67_08695 [Actinomycetia bacterium]|nr:hypothetical protein [Actinomycetes bacterium]